MRLLIADDHDLLRDTLVLYLEGEGDFDVSTARDFDDACRLIDAQPRFDLILLDVNMPGMHGLVGLKAALTRQGGQRVALISGEATPDFVQESLEAGAAGFVPKSMPAKAMINAVRFMANGEQFAPIEYMTPPQDPSLHPLAKRLTPREMQVLKGLTEGKSNKEIGRDLDIQEPTVKLHMKTMYRKIGASNRTQAALIARNEGLF